MGGHNFGITHQRGRNAEHTVVGSLRSVNIRHSRQKPGGANHIRTSTSMFA